MADRTNDVPPPDEETALPSTVVVAGAAQADDPKAELQRRMEDARESISRTVGEIRETVEDQYATAKDALSGILDLRENFQQSPILWSVGALSAGFALGYTVGRAERSGSFGRRHAGVGAFVDALVKEVGTVGSHLQLSTLNPAIARMLGFDLSQLFDEMRHTTPRRAARGSPRGGSRSTRRKKRSTVATAGARRRTTPKDDRKRH